MIFDVLFLPILFFIAFITCYEDFKFGKVRNKWIRLGIFWGLSVILILFLWYLVASPVTRFFYLNILGLPIDSPMPVYTVNPSYLGKVLLNFFTSVVVVFLMWRFGAWAAGDAKLFLVFALLLPLKYYWKSYFSFFPSFTLLANIFLLIFLYLLLSSFFFWVNSFRRKKGSVLRVFNLAKLLNKIWQKIIVGDFKKRVVVMASIVWVFLVLGLFRGEIESTLHVRVLSLQIVVFASFVIFNKFWTNVFQKPNAPKVIILFLVFTLGYGFIYSWTFTLQILLYSLIMLAVFMALFSFFNMAINFYVSKTSVGQLKIDSLKEKINLPEKVLMSIQKEDEEFFNQYLSKIYPDGLTVEQAKAIRRWSKNSGKYSKTIDIYKPFPFVVWMFLGLALTLILKTSLVDLFIKSIFSG